MGWERKRGKLHELNNCLRGATNTTFLPRRRSAAYNSRRALRHHSRRRHAFPRGSGGAPRRHDGPPAEPPQFSEEQGRVVEGYGISSAAHHSFASRDREGSIFQRIFSGPAASILILRLFRTFTRIFSVKAHTPAREFTTSIFSKLPWPEKCPKTFCSATICLKEFSRAPRLPRTSNSSTNSLLTTKLLPPASIAGRAAIGNSCPGSSGSCRDPRRRNSIPLSAAGKCWTICAGPFRRPACFSISHRMADAGTPSIAVDPIRARSDCDSGADSFPGRIECASEEFQSGAIFAICFGSFSGPIADRPDAYLSCLPGMADGGRHWTNTVSPLFHRINHVGVGHRRSGQIRST